LGGYWRWLSAERAVVREVPAVDYRNDMYPHSKPEMGVFAFVVRSVLFDGSAGDSETFSAVARVLPASQKLPASVTNGGTFPIRYSLPYIVYNIYADAWRPWTPMLDYDQQYTPASYYISPSTVWGPFPSNTQFTFNFYVWNYGASGQKFDVSAVFRVRLPSLPVHYRYYNSYYKITDYYVFEDWIRVVKP